MTFESAKKFLVDRIVLQSSKEGVPLSDLERDMLLFTEEPGPGNERYLEISERFDSEYDQDKYESKISKLIAHAYREDRKSPAESSWKDALKEFESHDLYLLVMIGQAGIEVADRESAEWDRKFTIVVVGFLVILIPILLFYFLYEDEVADLSQRYLRMEPIAALWCIAVVAGLAGYGWNFLAKRKTKFL